MTQHEKFNTIQVGTIWAVYDMVLHSVFLIREYDPFHCTSAPEGVKFVCNTIFILNEIRECYD